MTGKRRITWGVILLLVAGVLIWCAGQSSHEAQAKAQFQADRIQMEEVALWILERGSAEGTQPPTGWRYVRYYTQKIPVVDFALGGSGFGSQTAYWGVQYVPDDKPVGFQGEYWDYWKAKDGGRVYYDPEGDNRCYVKKLDTNWYYYEARF